MQQGLYAHQHDLVRERIAPIKKKLSNLQDERTELEEELRRGRKQKSLRNAQNNGMAGSASTPTLGIKKKSSKSRVKLMDARKRDMQHADSMSLRNNTQAYCVTTTLNRTRAKTQTQGWMTDHVDLDDVVEQVGSHNGRAGKLEVDDSLDPGRKVTSQFFCSTH